MSTTLSFSNAPLLTAADAIADACDAGSTNAQATLVIYMGTMPANCDTALSGNTVLSEHDMSNPAFGAAADDTPDALLTANAITDDSAANATGVPTFYRILDRDENAVIQGPAGTTGTALNITTANIVQDAVVSVTSLTVRLPE